MMRDPNKIVILIMGKSGCGKSTLERNLISNWPSHFKKVVSSTTRLRRPGEKHGVDYWFITDDEYDNTEFIQTTEFAGNRYGSSVAEYQTPHQFPILVVVPSSAADFTTTLADKHSEWGTFNIYFDISDDRLIVNMSNRGDSVGQIADRMSRDDLDKQFEESGLHPHLIATDDDLNDEFPRTVFSELRLHEISHEIRVNSRVNWHTPRDYLFKNR